MNSPAVRGNPAFTFARSSRVVAAARSSRSGAGRTAGVRGRR
ncbi:hypothetical protein ABT269_05275 [Streptomyces viridosporus]